MASSGFDFKKDWTCCFGRLHVQRATFLIAFSHVIILVSILCALTVNWLREHKTKFEEEAMLEFKFWTRFHDENLQDELDELFHLNEDLMLPKKVYLLCFMTITVVIFVGMMVYGVIKKVPCCVLPFYSWQILDLILSGVCIVLYFHYVQSMNKSEPSFKPAHDLALTLKLLDMTDVKYICLTLLTFVSILFLKIYAIVVVWRCFKYLAEIKSDMENNDCWTPTRYGIILTPTFAFKDCKPDQEIQINAIENDNSMLNDSDTTIFINEDLMDNECYLNLR